jgi:23S rRNA (adenine2503-C2)-methyltransferase
MLALDDLKKELTDNGFQEFRAKQVLQAVCKEGKKSYDEIQTLPKDLREHLTAHVPILSLEPVIIMHSRDGMTTKSLFQLKDGKRIESVLMRFKDGRYSVCVSSQVGCQLGCNFCATGTMKFGRNLTYEEIADQVLFYAQMLHKEDKRISNIVFMGMGEPFMNYDNVVKSLYVMNDPDGLEIGARNITVSTSGICEGIEKLTEEKIQVNLAVSLHAPNQELRAKIMPIARKYSLEQLINAIKQYIAKTHRRVSYEYVMLNNINDHEKEARELADLVKGQLCHINLIPYNATSIAGISGSLRKNIVAFRNIIQAAGIPVTIRVTMGQDIDAACGQLANKAESGQQPEDAKQTEGAQRPKNAERATTA